MRKTAIGYVAEYPVVRLLNKLKFLHSREFIYTRSMSDTLDASTRQRFSSRWGLIVSALGVAVGTGNIWRFPRIAAQTGGEEGAGAFLLAWVVFLFLWSIPLIISEYVLGRKFRSGVIGIFIKGLGKKFAWVGSFVAFVPLAITFFYTVVVGWCIYYFGYTLFNPLPETLDSAMQVWDHYQSGWWPMAFHLMAILFGALVIWKGVKSIERVNKILIPSLLVIVVLAVVRAITLPGSGDGLAYLFTPQWSQLTEPRTWLEALTQNAWDTGAGWGLFLTYAAYMKKEHGVVKNAFLTGIGNNTVSILSGIMIFGTVFAVLGHEMQMSRTEILEVMKTSGPASTGLTFIWMPQLFSKMFGGGILAVLFFLGLTFAGFSSLIAQLELPSRVLVDTGMKRNRAIILIIILVFICGLPSAHNTEILANQDFVWGVALMLSGALIASVIIRQGASRIRQEINEHPTDRNIGRWWIFVIRFFIPIAALILLFWWLIQSAVPGEWFKPFGQYTTMTCLFQWAVMIVAFLFLNRFVQKSFKG